MNYRFSSIIDSAKTLYAPTKYPLVLILAIVSPQTYAAPPNMGSITVTSRSLANGTASGTYIAAGSGAAGSFTLTRNNTRGYTNDIEIKPTGLPSTGTNGIEINNLADTNVSNDRFTYTFAITPNDNTAIHTIKIGQASYTTTGNSEVAQHTLNFTKSTLNNREVRAFVQSNIDVPYYYEAMGDYFMGSRIVNTNNFTYKNTVESPQLRFNSNSDLYFYRLEFLNGSIQGGNAYRPTTTAGNVSIRNGSSGFLPTPATFANIIKSTSTNPNNKTNYIPLTSDIANGGQYVSYGIENRASNYVIAVRNANTVTLTYEGIMNGSNGFEGEKIGETYNEWISFGVESEPLNYIFSGTVFNDNGGITNPSADNIDPPYSNNSDYFSGVFNSSESGIDVPSNSIPSRVSLVNDCSNPTQTFATQNLTGADAGVYRFTIPINDIGNRSAVCIIEDSNSGYPIRTTTEKIAVSFSAKNYNYPNNNFGRVIEANKALVLLKEQAINNCTITTLPPSAQNNLVYSKNTIENIEPGQCIAYRITAINRANLPVSEFLMRDKLQKAGVENARVTSTLVNPVHNSDDYDHTGGSVNVNYNGTVLTKPLSIGPRLQKIFYFNTKYGASQSSTANKP